jgi:hypothetical protein
MVAVMVFSNTEGILRELYSAFELDWIPKVSSIRDPVVWVTLFI